MRPVRDSDVICVPTPYPSPPLPEQHRIVAEIETQFTRLDASVAALRRVQANLKRYRASVLKAACEGRLVPTEAELARSEGRGYETRSRPAGAYSGRAPRPLGVSGEAAGHVQGILCRRDMPPSCRNCRRGGRGRRLSRFRLVFNTALRLLTAPLDRT